MGVEKEFKKHDEEVELLKVEVRILENENRMLKLQLKEWKERAMGLAKEEEE